MVKSLALFCFHWFSFFLSAPALNVWAYNWGGANIVLKQTHISPCLSNCSVSPTGICFLSLNWTLIVFQSRIAFIMICMKNASAVEMMIRIPVVMTGEIESWPCEEPMYCSRANVWQEWAFCSSGSRIAHCSSDSVQQLTQKDKVLWKGASQGSMQEQGLSTPSVTLVSLQIGFVLVDEGGRKAEKNYCFGSCLDPHLPPGPCLCQITLFSNKDGHALFSSFSFSLFLAFLFFLFFAPVWKNSLNTDGKQKPVEGI